MAKKNNKKGKPFKSESGTPPGMKKPPNGSMKMAKNKSKGNGKNGMY